MFREMRRKDRSIDEAQAINILKNGEYGVISTVGENGYAYGVPLNYVYMNGNVYFHCAVEGSKLDNIKYNNRVSFCVVGNAEPIPEKFSCRYESVILFGLASEALGKEKEDALAGLISKYSSAYEKQGAEYINRQRDNTKVVKIDIENICGKARR